MSGQFNESVMNFLLGAVVGSLAITMLFLVQSRLMMCIVSICNLREVWFGASCWVNQFLKLHHTIAFTCWGSLVTTLLRTTDWP